MDLLKSFISLLALINPVGAIPFFLSLTAQQSEFEKRNTIRIASISVFCVIAVTALLGEQIIAFFGISVGSLEVGGGIIMLLMAINMLNAQIGNTRSTPEERHEAEIEEQHRRRAAGHSASDRAGLDQHGDRLFCKCASLVRPDRFDRDRRGARRPVLRGAEPRRADCALGRAHRHQYRYAV